MRTLEEVVDEIARYNSMDSLDREYVRKHIGERLSEILEIHKAERQKRIGKYISGEIGYCSRRGGYGGCPPDIWNSCDYREICPNRIVNRGREHEIHSNIRYSE